MKVISILSLAQLVWFTVATAQEPVTNAPHEPYDFNFDGHPDYRVRTIEDGKADRYDVFIWDPATGRPVKNALLSGTINPLPDPSSREIHCVWPGGHSGRIFSEEVYGWENGQVRFLASIRQTPVHVEGKLLYARARAVLREGKPVIESIELVAIEE